MTRRERRRLGLWLGRGLLLLVPLLLAEGATRALVGAGLLPFERHPTTARPTFWDDLSASWGVWHLPDAEFQHLTPCFDATYRSNVHGMRDRPRALESDAAERIVVLGDSFVEGVGVARAQRFTDLLEAESGIEHLNFGTSGDFGTLQEWLLYRDLACRFEHSEVWLFTLPFNDARDMDARHFPKDRYRPYLEPLDEGGYRVVYPVAFEDRHRVLLPTSDILRNTVSNHVYLFNVLRRFVRSMRSEPWTVDGSPTYARYGEAEIGELLFCYEQIVRAAAGRPVRLFLIPAETDFAAALAGGLETPLLTAVRTFAAEHEGVTFTDLLPAFVADAQRSGRSYRDYLLICDGHWNELGHRVAADAIAGL